MRVVIGVSMLAEIGHMGSDFGGHCSVARVEVVHRSPTRPRLGLAVCPSVGLAYARPERSASLRVRAYAVMGSRVIAGVYMGELEIRSARDVDLPQLTEIYNYYIVNTAFTFDLEPFSVERRRSEWFSYYAPNGPHRVLVAISTAGRVQGFTYSSMFRPKAAYATSVETSVYCAPEAIGQGIGRRLYEALFDELGKTEVQCALALITRPNEPSEALHQKMGFELSGVWSKVGRKFGRYWDVAVWQREIRQD